MVADPFGPLVVIVVVVATLVYALGVAWAAALTLRTSTHEPLPQPMRYAVTSIGAVLAAHLGFVLGLPPTRAAFFAVLGMTASPPPPAPSGLQIFAAYAYLACLFAAFVTWAIARFRSSAEDTIKEMTFTLIGVFAAVMAVALKVGKTP
jgi:hypothetical protein